MTIGRSAAAVTGGDGRESATDFVLTAVRQYEYQCDVINNVRETVLVTKLASATFLIERLAE